MRWIARLGLLTCSLIVVVGCSGGDQAAQGGGTTPAATGGAKTDAATTGATTDAASSSTQGTKPEPAKGDIAGPTPPKDGEEVAVIDTNLGRIVFRFLSDKAPKTVDNFKQLSNKKFYDGTKFHRVIPNFMIQGGDPKTKTPDRASYGTGGPGYTIADEFSDVSHVRGIVSMANTGQPNSSGSQFFICVGDPTFLNGKYSAFGQVVEGMDVADKIVALPRDAKDDPTPDEAKVKSIKIEKWPLKDKK